MTKILLIEDDPVTKKVWESHIHNLLLDAEITSYPSIDQFIQHENLSEELDQSFDVLISDIFLAGDKTGIDLIKKMPLHLQEKTILTSTISEVDYYAFSIKHNLTCQFVKKPVDKAKVQVAIQKVLQKQKSGHREVVNLSPRDLKLNATDKKLSIVKPVFLVTSGHSPMGEILCKKLIANNNYRVAITAPASSVEALQKEFGASTRVLILPLDMNEPDQIKDTVLAVLKRWDRIDVLVNNASICYRAVTEHMDLETEMKQFRANFLSPMVLIRSVIPVMRENGRGKIINFSSASGIMGMPTMGSYTSSKMALEGSSESLWYELKPLGVNVTVVRSDFVSSDSQYPIVTSNKAHLSENLMGPYSDYYKFIRPFLKRFMSFDPETPEVMADLVLEIVQTQNPPLWVNANFKTALFSTLHRLLPSNLFHWVMLKYYSSDMKLAQKYTKASVRRLSA